MKCSDKRVNGFWVYWFPAFSYMLLIFFLSSRSSFPLSPPSIPYIDKIFHLVEFAVLGYLLVRAFLHSNNPGLQKYALLLAIVITILFGLTDELHQFFVPLRQGDFFDLISDSLGAVIGSFGALWINRDSLIKKGKKSSESQGNIF